MVIIDTEPENFSYKKYPDIIEKTVTVMLHILNDI